MTLVIEELMARLGRPITALYQPESLTTGNAPEVPTTPSMMHARDVSRLTGRLQRCSCGHVTRTIEEMSHHIADARSRSPL